MARRTLTDEEKALLKAAMRDVTPLNKTVVQDSALPPSPPASPVKRRAVMPVSPPPAKVGVDTPTMARVRRGEYKIEARLDLHGMTLDVAHQQLQEFVETSYHARKRCVLVITGKGGREEGRLQQEVPRWLAFSQLSRMILMVSSAQPKHGGDGALYLLLKRRKS